MCCCQISTSVLILKPVTLMLSATILMVPISANVKQDSMAMDRRIAQISMNALQVHTTVTQMQFATTPKGPLCVHASQGGLEKSSILSNYGNDSYLQVLTTYLDPVLQDCGTSNWNLCWHARSDGWDVEKQFHPKCDGRGPSVTIVRVNQYIFGGYTDVSWHKNLGCTFSNQSFLYSLYSIKGYQPVKLNLTGLDNNKYAILGYATNGPTFGCDYLRPPGLYISNNASSNFQSHSYLGQPYQKPPKCKISCSEFFVGSRSFKPSDVEVFYETTS
ncbi:hypothetical protein AC249_AIPGENE7482 [Exaiptasia diaphana]|nr:hypothetical protein AC249_AIPGENE7482 [Exaiptasia diaphana]